MPIRINTGQAGWVQVKASFKKNRKHYLQEAMGLAIFMISACFFGALLFSDKSIIRDFIQDELSRNAMMGIMMGGTALFIFYSPWTAPGGSHINPAVTLTFLRMDKICRYDAFFYILFQFLGGTLAVWLMQGLMGDILTAAPVHSVVTVPGPHGVGWALVTEFFIAFITMFLVLYTSGHSRLKKYTRLLAACLVCAWVMLAGPVSGFGMNPARSFASAFPSGIWTGFWIYLFIPLAGMFLAAEAYLLFEKMKVNNHHPGQKAAVVKKNFHEPFEYML